MLKLTKYPTCMSRAFIICCLYRLIQTKRSQHYFQDSFWTCYSSAKERFDITYPCESNVTHLVNPASFDKLDVAVSKLSVQKVVLGFLENGWFPSAFSKLPLLLEYLEDLWVWEFTRAPNPGAKMVSPCLLATTVYNPRGLRPLGLYTVVASKHGLTYTWVLVKSVNNQCPSR